MAHGLFVSKISKNSEALTSGQAQLIRLISRHCRLRKFHVYVLQYIAL